MGFDAGGGQRRELNRRTADAFGQELCWVERSDNGRLAVEAMTLGLLASLPDSVVAQEDREAAERTVASRTARRLIFMTIILN